MPIFIQAGAPLIAETCRGLVLDAGAGRSGWTILRTAWAFDMVACHRYPSYLGVDVSAAAVAVCQKNFAGDIVKAFIALDEFHDLALSLDVIHHLVEDAVFDAHLRDLFGPATPRSAPAVPIGSSTRRSCRHREFMRWIARRVPEWRLAYTCNNPYPRRRWNRANSSDCDLFLFERKVAS